MLLLVGFVRDNGSDMPCDHHFSQIKRCYVRYYYPDAGESIDNAIRNAIALVLGTGEVEFSFNGIILRVNCYSNRDDVYAEYRLGVKKQYENKKGYLESELFEIL
jgi:hypothetical protein